MKKTTCRDLKGACDVELVGETAEEMGERSRAHVMEMVAKGDQAHLDAIEEMKQLTPEEQQAWYQEFNDNFDSLLEA